MSVQKQMWVVLFSSVMITACLASLLWPKGELATSVKPHKALGRILAEDLAERLGPGTRLLVFTAGEAEDEPAGIQARSFLDRCRKAGLEVVFNRELMPFEQGREDPQKELPAQIYLDMLDRHPDVDAFVSFVGFPRLTRRHAEVLPASWTPMFAVSRSANELKDMLLADILECAVVPRFAFPAPADDRSPSYQQWFDRYFQRIDTIDDLPLGSREMPVPRSAARNRNSRR